MALGIGDPIVPFTLEGVDRKSYTPAAFRSAPVLVVIFWSNTCPYVRAWEDRVIALQRAHAGRGVQVVAINSNDVGKSPEDSFDKMQERAAFKTYPFPYLTDPTQEVAQRYGASRTPEVFLFDARRNLRYHGVPDDNYEDPSAVRQNYVVDAIEAVLAKRPPAQAQTPLRGCTIKWRDGGA